MIWRREKPPESQLAEAYATSCSTQVYSPAIINYGAIAQTWEDPEEPDDDTGLGGDNDPIDVLQLNEGSCERGAVQRVRVLGGLALVDGAETG